MKAWLDWMRLYYSEKRSVPGYDNFEVDRAGNVYKDGIPVVPFNSSGYLQICLTSPGKRRVVKGVHQVISMTFDPNYYEGCVVHHYDENKHNNRYVNLIVESRVDHSRHHADPNRLVDYIKINGPVNKGKKMSKEFCEHCRQSALKRAERDKINHVQKGNQFRNADGSKKQIDPEAYEKFREACRRGALKRYRKYE